MDINNPYSISSDSHIAALAERSERATFIQKTYAHLGVAIIGFVVLEGILLTIFPPQQLWATLGPMLSGFGWLIVLGAFMVVSWIARGWAESGSSRAIQYAGLGMYVVAQALLFLPLMAASLIIEPGGSIPMNAGIITAIVFGGLTAMVFLTGTDFSGLGKFLWIGGLVAMGMIAASLVMPFGLGTWFSGLMVLLASGYILYDTSNVMKHYRTDQHVAASLALFASVALLLWYVIQILISMRD